MEETGLKEGEKIAVKLLEIDPKTGKFRLSHRALEEKPEGWEDRPARPRRERGDRPRRENEEGEQPRTESTEQPTEGAE